MFVGFGLFFIRQCSNTLLSLNGSSWFLVKQKKIPNRRLTEIFLRFVLTGKQISQLQLFSFFLSFFLSFFFSFFLTTDVFNTQKRCQLDWHIFKLLFFPWRVKVVLACDSTSHSPWICQRDRSCCSRAPVKGWLDLFSFSLFLEIIKRKKRWGQEVLTAVRLVFFSPHESPAQFAQFLCEMKVASAAHGVDVLLGSSGQAQGEDVAAPAAGPPGALGATGRRWQPGKLEEVPRERCSSRPTSTSCRTIPQKGSETWWTSFGTQRKDVRAQKMFKRTNYFAALKDYPTFCLTEPQPAEDLRGSQYLRAGSASSLPLGGVDSVMSKCWLCISYQLPMNTTRTKSHAISWMLDDYFPCI